MVAAALRSSGFAVGAFVDRPGSGEGRTLCGAPVLTTLPIAGSQLVSGIGDNTRRRQLVDTVGSGVAWVIACHASSVVDPSAEVAPGALVGAAAVLQPACRVGPHAVVNTAAVVEHDCLVEAFAHVAPGAVLLGGVVVGEGALVGGGARVMRGVRIGAWARVGVGAVVLRDVPPGVTVAGVPARPLN